MNAFLSHDVLELPGIVLLLDRTGIDASATSQGNNIGTWDDRISGITFEDIGSTDPTLNLDSGRREVSFAATSGMYTVTEPAVLDFVMGTDSMSVIAKIGETYTSQSTIIGKTSNGTADMQYQCNVHNDTGTPRAIGHNFGSDTGSGFVNSAFVRADTGAVITGGDVLAWTVDGTDSEGATVYKNGVAQAYTLGQVNWPPTTVGVGGGFYNTSNGHPVYIGCRRDDADTSIGFSGEFDLAYLAVYNRELSSAEVTLITNNLQNI